MTYKQMIIDDQKETIRRLQDECTEKTNAIIALGEKLKSKEQECDKAKQNAQDTYDLWQALIESFNILQGEKIKLEQECEKLKRTITYIKEITEENIRIADLEGLNGVYRRGLAKQILQKISDYGVEND